MLLHAKSDARAFCAWATSGAASATNQAPWAPSREAEPMLPQSLTTSSTTESRLRGHVMGGGIEAVAR
eukprot:8836673-Alexandrium_andersonii.AAC.1